MKGVGCRESPEADISKDLGTGAAEADCRVPWAEDGGTTAEGGIRPRPRLTGSGLCLKEGIVVAAGWASGGGECARR